ncbi:MAG TPA: DUF4124 domain-containing protein [Gammaproteobacteria bacterium]|nr:DUF4124 domain-containing protein [Gammaproteobacteria bacterium]
MNKQTLCVALLTTVALTCLAAHADQAYRWVDAQGNVHYSQTPPPDAVTKAKLVDIVPQPMNAAGAEQQQQLVKSMDAAKEAKQKTAAAAQQQAQQKAEKQQTCDAARKRLQGYMQAHKVITNANSANPTYYTGDDLVKFRQQAQEQVDKLCAGL